MSYILKFSLKTLCSLRNTQKSLRYVIAILIMFNWMECHLCYGENQNNQIASLFKETQQASVFYLDNGMEVILIENHASPMIAAVTIVKTGSRNEDEASNGSAHFLEHLLFNGTKTRTQKQIYDEMDFYGGYNNAHTGQDYTNYMILMPKEYIAQGMDIQADMLFNSTLPDEKFEKERGIVIEEIGKDADQPEYQADNHFHRIFYAGTPYERPILGTVSTITHLKRERVWEYYQTWYVPNNMILMVIGDFSTPEMVKLVKEKYGSYPAGPIPEHKTIALNPPDKLQLVTANGMDNFPKNRQYLTLGYFLPPPVSDDFQTLVLLSEFLGNRKDAILKTLFNQEQYKNLIDSIDTSIDFNHDFSTLKISAELPVSADAGRVVELIVQAVQGLTKNAIPASEVESTLIARVTHELYLQESLHYYGMMKSGYLAAGGYTLLRNYLDGLMKVTPASVQKVAEKYLKTQVPVATLMTPPVEKTPEQSTAQSVNQYKMEILKNGLTVVVKESHDSRVAGIHLLAKERSLSEGKEKWGMTEILQRMLIDGGTTVHPDDTLYQGFESIGAEIKVCDDPSVPFDDYYHTPRFAYIRLKVIDTFFEKGLKLLSEMILKPNLTEKAFAEAKKDVVSLSTSVGMSTPKIAERIFYDNLFKENPGFGRLFGDIKHLEQIQLKDVQNFHQKFYNPANLILVISANIPVEKALLRVREYLGGDWGEMGWQPPAFTPQFKSLGTRIREKMGKQQSYISVANICEVGEEDQPALSVMEAIFGDRLAFNLREKQGLAYSIGVSFNKYKGAQWYRISMGTRPENIERAINGICKEIHSMREAKIEEPELQKTVNAILGRRGMRRLDRVNQSYYISMKVLDGKGPEADDQEIEKLKKVTIQDVERLARQVFQNDNYLIVIVE
ncbi:Protease 3 precursor [Candidatus Brocadiaceae bacterium B188]|nr:MAG: insulinase family protein [Candidatus Brocadia sp.]RZV56273.1 MAG: insulinase family protein [Candidatus Brocadia sp. BROELEC01]TWU52217.1 Protease 3 precursor [Candidatus Brocadiaceae bacterium B188]